MRGVNEAGILVEQRHRRIGAAQILMGEHRAHAGQGERRVRVDPREAGLGVGAAQDRRMGHARQVDVVDEPRSAGEQPAVLAPLDRLADQPRGHRPAPRSSAAARRTAATIC